MIRIGSGYDSHKICQDKSFKKEEQRELVLGGVKINDNSKYYVYAHSDGDALIHSLIDAILSSLGKNDIGNMFPDTDEKYKKVSSLKLLREVKNMVTEQGYKIEQVNVILILDKPKISPFINEIKKVLVKELDIKENRISIASKTTEGKYDIKQEGLLDEIKAFSQVLLKKMK